MSEQQQLEIHAEETMDQEETRDWITESNETSKGNLQEDDCVYRFKAYKEYRKNHPGPLSKRSFRVWCQNGGKDKEDFKWSTKCKRKPSEIKILRPKAVQRYVFPNCRNVQMIQHVENLNFKN
ncbi:uncharacterized protein LOC130648752 [Hydractinia symbiolongicarpus]|uniref:uncharacterized protein LOC130648752 n=1 Tax=Hydractinia symbiolongicarpus TaxID=13093 RepID=UPI00254A3DAA|nr:uncharacterized protein LOC130648752 [Hydractinia symbiolongicarpus]